MFDDQFFEQWLDNQAQKLFPRFSPAHCFGASDFFCVFFGD